MMNRHLTRGTMTFAGHIYEPDGIDGSKLKTIMKIKSERGERHVSHIPAS